MTLPRWLPVTLLALLVALSGWWLYRLQRAEEPPALVGPPRSDYTLEAFELVALDDTGGESFSVQGPRLARHPYLGTLNIERPQMRFLDDGGATWNTRATTAFVSKDADLVRMEGDVRVQGPAEGDAQPLLLSTAKLNFRPDADRIDTDAAVTITGPGSILRGRDLEADLDTRRFDLAEMEGRYDIAR